MEQSYKQKFYDKYIEIIPKFKKFESTRKRLCVKRNFSLFIGYSVSILICSVLMFLCLNSPDNKNLKIWEYLMSIFCCFCGSAAAFMFIMVYFDKDNYTKQFAQMLKKECFDELFSVFDFIEKTEIKELPVSSMYHNSYNKSEKLTIIDDSFKGCYKDTEFSILEVSNAMMRGRMGVYGGPWSGVIINMKFNKLSKTIVYISPKSDCGIYIMILGGIISCIISVIVFNLLLILFCFFWTGCVIYGYIKGFSSRVDLEDNDFHKKFYIDSDDQVESRYILTPMFMERLKNLKTAFGSKNIWCYVDNEQITIAIETKKDLFEIGNLYVPVSDSKQVRQFYDEIIAICDIIDHFKLNEKTGL